MIAAADGPSGTSAVPVSGGMATMSRGTDASSIAQRAAHGWAATEAALQALTGHNDLTGQSVIAEARRQQKLSLGEAHALAALHHWSERAVAGPAEPRIDAERAIAREALEALEHAVSVGARELPPASATGASAYIDSVAALGAPPPPRVDTKSEHNRAADWDVGRQRDSDIGDSTRVSHDVAWYRRFTGPTLYAAALGLLLVAVVGIGVWSYVRDRSVDSMYRDSVAAYQRGAVEVARTGFARVAQLRPEDARPLVFLGRIERDRGSLANSRRFLEAAIRRAPENALAQREFAATMLADGQPEIARRFYVRAIQLDPSDRNAQGFLGCALVRLNRFDEARRWFERAGQGEWAPCAAALPPAVYGPYTPGPPGYPQPYGPAAPAPAYPPPYPPQGR